MSLDASFTIIINESDRQQLVIADDDLPGRRSVTNDAERVCEKLTELGEIGPSKPGRRLLYYDSMNELSELVIDEAGKWLGFKAI